MGRFAGRLAPLPALLLLLAPVGIGGDAAAAPAPSCAEGPVRVGDTIHGTGCDDTIVVPASVTRVDGGAGADTIVPGQIVAAAESCPVECRLKVGSQVFEGGPGPDVVFGERGNDILRGGGGDDQLFGGIGDDLLLGGPGNDRLSGGFGADSIDGEEGDDYVRGDGTIDTILDTGGGADTLSFATGITPGFPDASEKKPYPDFSLIDGLPAAGGERGVYLNLAVGGENADDGEASLGGGVDKIEGQSFETVIGTPFSDYIVGTAAAQRVFGGGGADVIRGGTGADELHGGADGDFLEAAAGASAD
ncbi:MAG: hypothetical protein JJE35_03790, partial [Thermoleophilia bacterium]|nr:hypothetical protein [Thermoleophilia bacterium]